MLAGRERGDGNDETVLEGTRKDSSFPNGFWHPYGRGANVPPTRVVAFAPEALAQVTLRLPSSDEIAAAQVLVVDPLQPTHYTIESLVRRCPCLKVLITQNQYKPFILSGNGACQLCINSLTMLQGT